MMDLRDLQAPETAVDVPEQGSNLLDGTQQAASNMDPGNMPSPPRRETREREILHAFGELGAAKEVRCRTAFARMPPDDRHPIGNGSLRAGQHLYAGMGKGGC